MWCAVHVRAGTEKNMEDFLAAFLPGSLHARCFHLTRSRKKKYKGRWQIVREDLFPGYVFIDTDEPDRVQRELEKAPGPRLLFSSDGYVSILEKRESDFMTMISDGNGVIGISRAEVAEDRMVKYLSGPLRNVGNRVRRINFHKRVAEVEADFLGRRQILYLGIEIDNPGG